MMTDAKMHKGARVIVRADLDVPVRGSAVEDDTRLRAHERALRFLIAARVRIRIIGHRGRPGGKADKNLTLKPVSRALSRMLGRNVFFVQDPFSAAAYAKYRDADDIVMFENIRFWPGEERNGAAFARSCARWGDLYINEAFANCHRNHASMVALARILPSYAGWHTAEEVASLEKVISHAARPLVAILGGAKIETKLPLIKKFLGYADRVLIGGALANTIFSLTGKDVGKSVIDSDAGPSQALFSHKKLCLPTDVIVTKAFHTGAHSTVRGIDEVRPDDRIVDIGPKTQALFQSYVGGANTVVWNGPLGLAEVPKYAKGTRSLARSIARSRAFSVVGGGDTIAALRRMRMLKGFSHVSTGGGAMLEFLAGKVLPGIEVLKK